MNFIGSGLLSLPLAWLGLGTFFVRICVIIYLTCKKNNVLIYSVSFEVAAGPNPVCEDNSRGHRRIILKNAKHYSANIIWMLCQSFFVWERERDWSAWGVGEAESRQESSQIIDDNCLPIYAKKINLCCCCCNWPLCRLWRPWEPSSCRTTSTFTLASSPR